MSPRLSPTPTQALSRGRVQQHGVCSPRGLAPGSGYLLCRVQRRRTVAAGSSAQHVQAFTASETGWLMASQLPPSFPQQGSPSGRPVGDPAERSLVGPQPPDPSSLPFVSPRCGWPNGDCHSQESEGGAAVVPALG